MRHRHAAERREREAHRHPVVVVGVDRRRRERARRRSRCSRSSPASTVAPSLRSSVAIAAMRSVSFTRQLAMPVSVVGPSREQRDDRERHRRVGNRVQSIVDAVQARVPARASIQSSPQRDRRRPCARARRRTRRRPGSNRGPTPVTRTGPPPIAPAARKYDADDASPSTRSVPGLAIARAGRHANDRHSSRSTATPKRRIRLVVIVDVRLARSARPSTVDAIAARAPCTSGSAISSADRNWLDTSPRIAHRRVRRARAPAPIASGGKPSVAEVADVGAERAQRVDEIADRPLVHARHAVELVVAAGERERGRQRAQRRAGVAEKQVARRLTGNGAACAVARRSRALPRSRSTSTPSARSASSIRSMSSASSRPVRRRVACARAPRAAACGWRCSSSPGSATDAFGVRAAAAKRRRVGRAHRPRSARAARRPRLPAGRARCPTRGARRWPARTRASSAAPSPAATIARDRGRARRAIAVDLGQQRVAVGERDVAPHLGRARRRCA